MLTIQNLSFSYGAIEILDDVSMTMPGGGVTCVLGRNGAGKTTLMNSVMGLIRPSRGAIQMGVMDITGLSSERRSAIGLGLVPQGRRIFPKLTVEENLRVALAARGRWKAPLPDDVFELFPVLHSLRNRRGGDLSGGQQQQLAIGRALVANPSTLLLDEPTEGIQPNVIQHIGDVLRRLANERGMTIVVVEQYLNFVREIGDRFFLLDRRRVVASGPTSDLSTDLINRHLSV